MNVIRAIFKNLHSRVWFIVTCAVVVLGLIVNILASCTFLYNLIGLVLGQRQAIYAEGVQAAYEFTTESKEDATASANELVEEVAGEGIVMMKNDGALPLQAGAKVSVFGKNSVNLVYSGSGSGGGDNSEAKTIYDSLSAAGIEYNDTLKRFYENESQSGAPRGENENFSQDMAKFDTAETPYENYTEYGITDSYAQYSDAALIVISRIGGEEFDLTNSELRSRDRHYLELDANEQALVENVCAAGFEHVILIVNSANVMELGFVESDAYGDIDACLWMGAPGNNGVMALGRILNGEITPSGHTVDTWIADMTKDPTYNNFGDNGTANGDRYTLNGANQNAYFVDYEEGIYVGYRYYETADYEARNGNYPGFDYDEQVVYPFGFGLSYTTFEWTIEDDSSIRGATIDGEETYSVTVSVENTGDYSGKDVIQLYVNAPYEPDGTEKAYKVLCGFVKTDLLEPGEKEEYTIEFEGYDFASYDQTGSGGYVLDGGAYTLFVSRNAHDDAFEIPFSVASDGIRYENDPTTGNKVENRFDAADDQLGSVLSRSDFAGTWPQTRTEGERAALQEFIDSLSDYDSGNNETYTQLPTTGYDDDTVIEYTYTDEDGNEVESTRAVELKDLVGLSYDDDLWNKFLDRFTASEMATLYNNGAFMTEAIERLGVPKTTESDGPVGFVAFQGSATVYGTCNYCCEVMMASTWNVDLLAAIGESMAQEGLWGNQAGDGMPYSGIYAPGANIHRSPFGGRNWEYFSEDGFLSGELAAAQIKAAREDGLAMYMKHFALNEQETHRNANGLCTWATEQSIRELYLKPFEKAVKEGETLGIMSSFNRIGSEWAGGSYALLTEVLRDEWGFRGTVISDYLTASYCDPVQMIYAGGDLSLTSTPRNQWRDYDESSAADVTMLRRAAKNVLYTIAHTNALNGEIIGYMPPVWQIVMFIVDGVLVVGLAVWGVFAVRGALKKEKKQQKE